MTTQQHTHSEHTHMPLNIQNIFSTTSALFEKAFLPLLALYVVSLITVVSVSLFFIAILFGIYFISTQSVVVIGLLAICSLILLVLIIWFLCAVPIMAIEIIHKPSYEFESLFRKALKQVPSVFTILALVGLAQFGGFLLGILPGIWLSIVLQFVFIIAVLEHKSHKESIAESAYLVKGNFWKVFAAIFGITILSFLISIIPIFGLPLSVLFGFFMQCFIFALYKILKHNRISDSTVIHTNKKLVRVVYALAAFAAVAIMVLISIIVFIAGLYASNYQKQSPEIIDSRLEASINTFEI